MFRFVGAIGSKGELLAYKRRAGLKPMMDANSTKYHFSQVALKNDMESFFDKSLGNVEFVPSRELPGKSAKKCRPLHSPSRKLPYGSLLIEK